MDGNADMPDIAPVILAAGDSSRMGYPKALLPLGDETFLARILRTLDTLALPAARVVLGLHEPRIRPLLEDKRVRILINPNPARGQASSIRLALASLEPDIAGCLIWPVDQPLVSPDLVRSLMRLFTESSAVIALPRCQGIGGHPAIFGRTMIHELLAAPPEANPKLMVARHADETVWLETGESGAVEDIDTPEDYFRLVGEPLASALSRQRLFKI
jgi:molybdenum cofactor cytidylyltransferase